jgi:hypothetical protein
MDINKTLLASVVTDEAVPVEQRLVGVVTVIVLLSDPQTPFTATIGIDSV